MIGEPPEGIEADAEKLVALAGANGWVAHEALGRAWLALARARQGRMEGVAESLQASLHVLRQARYGSFNPLILAELAAILSASGRVAEALSLIAEHHQKDGNPEIWCGPELLRREAELRLSTSDQETARQCLLRARQWSEAQGARLWLDFLAPSESLGIARA
ncbi:hypothetical protein IAI18_07465 [Acetobacteraceae bacterium H6797]|nr:hypothetical protein [Acetobacteraceae bacterium H6797]